MHEISPNHISYNPVFDEEFDGNVRFYPPAHRLPELEIRPLPVAALGGPRHGEHHGEPGVMNRPSRRP